MHAAALGEESLELAAAPLHPRLDAGDAEPLYSDDLGVGLPVEVDGADRRAVRLGQSANEGAETRFAARATLP